jgi:hypothetical protein
LPQLRAQANESTTNGGPASGLLRTPIQALCDGRDGGIPSGRPRVRGLAVAAGRPTLEHEAGDQDEIRTAIGTAFLTKTRVSKSTDLA